MTVNRTMKRIVRDLQELRGVSYTEALRELRGLPEDVNWKEYVTRVALEEGGQDLLELSPEEKFAERVADAGRAAAEDRRRVLGIIGAEKKR